MTVTISGDTGISAVQAGAVESGDLPAGSVIQVVQGSTNTQINVSTTSYTDTGLSAAITPSLTSSKILILIDQHIFLKRNGDVNIGSGFRLLRDSTVVAGGESLTDTQLTVQNAGNLSMELLVRRNSQYLDSPSTTSEITYKTQGRPDQTSNGGLVIYQHNSIVSHMTLMEIAG